MTTYGQIVDINTTVAIRPATREEWLESMAAHGGTGAIRVDDYPSTVYVSGGPDADDAQIETLRTEAGVAGDDEQVALCDIALGSTPTLAGRQALAVNWPGLDAEDPGERDIRIARAECERVIAEAV